MSIIFSESWGNSSRSLTCQKYVNEYLEIVKNILRKGMEKGEIRKLDIDVLATQILGIACGNLYYKKTEALDIQKLYKQIDKNFIQGLKKN